MPADKGPEIAESAPAEPRVAPDLAVPQPVLVYDRIAANRRNTLLLLVVFGMLFVLFAAFMEPWLNMLFQTGTWRPPGNSFRTMAARLATDWTWQDELTLATDLFVFALGVGAVCAGLLTLLVYYVSASFARWVAGARPVRRDEALTLSRTVENLCIGAGLPPPRLSVVETSAPNAFATGRDPQHAVLTVTRGLLQLLNRRELEAVIAHELSHIGNYDTRLSSTVTGLRAALLLSTLAAAPLYPLFLLLPIGLILIFLGLTLYSSCHAIGCLIYGRACDFGFGQPPSAPVYSQPWGWGSLPWYFRWYEWGEGLLYLVAPFYLLVVTPLIASGLSRVISRQREFLADADAVLLTRDPEGLALALAKIGAAGATRMRFRNLTAHLCIVDPYSHERRGVSGARSATHPSVEERIAELTRMGSGKAAIVVQTRSPRLRLKPIIFALASAAFAFWGFRALFPPPLDVPFSTDPPGGNVEVCPTYLPCWSSNSPLKLRPGYYFFRVAWPDGGELTLPQEISPTTPLPLIFRRNTVTRTLTVTSASDVRASADGIAQDYGMFGFNIAATAIVTKILVSLGRTTPTGDNELHVSLSWNGGVSFTKAQSTKTSQPWYSVVLGEADPVWGRTWEPTDLSDANFRVRIARPFGSTTDPVNLDSISVVVFLDYR